MMPRVGYMPVNSFFRTFDVEKQVPGLDDRGRTKPTWTPSGKLTGVLADATPREQERLSQQQHPVTHMISSFEERKAGPGDRLVLGERRFYVQTIEEGNGAVIYKCEERHDL